MDDEPLALAQMSKYIGNTPFLELVAACRNTKEAQEILSGQEIDILFADIQMPGLNGLDFVRLLPVKPLIVFTTAFPQYALDGFRVDAIDYLLKPISYKEFLRSAEKAYRQFTLLEHSKGQELPEVIFVRSEYKTIPLAIKDIIYVESRSEYVRIFTATSRPVMSLGSMKSYEEKLKDHGFMRIHRSYIINLQKIKAIERKHILLRDGKQIPIGELYEEKFRKYISG
jgi:two-component system LytT family response regulator